MTGRDPAPEEPWPLGPRLRAARERVRLSQNKAAEAAGVSRTLWQQLEAGGRSDRKPFNPKSDSVIRAARAVELNPREALELAGIDPGEYDASRAGRPTVTEAELRQLYSRLTRAQQQAVVDLLRAFLESDPAPSPTTAEPYRRGTALSGPERGDQGTG